MAPTPRATSSPPARISSSEPPLPPDSLLAEFRLPAVLSSVGSSVGSSSSSSSGSSVGSSSVGVGEGVGSAAASARTMVRPVTRWPLAPLAVGVSVTPSLVTRSSSEPGVMGLLSEPVNRKVPLLLVSLV